VLTGLILAGGPEPQMDGNLKALLPFGGEALVQLQIREMRKICQEVIVATPDPKPFLREVDTGIRIITDYHLGKGPLNGMYAGFSLSSNRDVWVVGSHMPFLSAKAAELLVERKQAGFDAALPIINGGIYTLHGVYDKRCADCVQAVLSQGQRTASLLIRDLYWSGLPDSIFVELGVDPCFVRSFDTWEEYRQILETVADI
jgi:molybdenum cofactor guanylyltransferase